MHISTIDITAHGEVQIISARKPTEKRLKQLIKLLERDLNTLTPIQYINGGFVLTCNLGIHKDDMLLRKEQPK